MDRNVYEACSDLIRSHHGVASADEVLGEKIGHQVPVPVPAAEEVELAAKAELEAGDNVLPHMDLKVLHYFMTQLVVQKYEHLVGCFDETALVTLGLIVEEWVREYLRAAGGSAGPGPALVVSKETNYRHSPADI
ncbi:AFR180Cp [Eremothecium gossypii ATCC 10895]|uniref:AFR180Cp n=1 Tax=Eremothecium gossypii (strain ATCC 10895 / CBS 109.51 / FGSC 9923 / NRRL Y-1056) TaxID=284811 RepID=Q753Z2_EREGS|nr:AFR180Cp [Eremothecium gossypii ATCC 10895]AAS53551.1 AFR180Cp [Eremothecium gossypii ATCC 10895]AEY97864.1 FAFR180Cp [Eremothecium gossypii FDAG1]